MDFKEQKELAAKDCEQVAATLMKLAAEVREGNMAAFEAFWFEGGTEEGDAQIVAVREMILLRYFHRAEASLPTANANYKAACEAADEALEEE